MADEVATVDFSDRLRIDLRVREEIDYWMKTLGVTELDLRAAVKRVGNFVDDVKTHLKYH